MFLSLFNSFASAKCPPDIVCLQDSPFWRSRLPSFQNYTSFAPPGGSGNRPQVAFYVSTHLLPQATVLPAFFDRHDVVALDLFGVDLFGKSFSHFRILNLYNLWTKRTSQMRVSPLVAFPATSFPTLVVGDFNIHHPLPDPLRSHSAEELATSFTYFSRSTELGFGLLNQPRVYTRFPLGGSGRPLFLIFPWPPLCCFPFVATLWQDMGHPPPLHWLRPRSCPNHTLASIYLSRFPLLQLLLDRLARPRPTTHGLCCSSTPFSSH